MLGRLRLRKILLNMIHDFALPSLSVVVVLIRVQWHDVVARIIAGAGRMLRSENPVFSEIEKLIPDNDVICQTGKPHALSRMAHAFLVGNHDEYPQAGSSNVRLRGTEKQLIKESASRLTEKNWAGMTYSLGFAAPRQEKKSFRTDSSVKRAEKTGRTVTSVTTPDGTIPHFDETKPSDVSNPWLADLPKVKQ